MSKNKDNQINFSVEDIANLVKIIDYAADQGAFKGFDVMRDVITVRDKMHFFVTEITKQAEAAKSDSESDEVPEKAQEAEKAEA